MRRRDAEELEPLGWFWEAVIVLAILLLVLGGAALARPKLTYAGGKVVGLSNLSTDEGCLPAKLTGKVVKRELADA